MKIPKCCNKFMDIKGYCGLSFYTCILFVCGKCKQMKECSLPQNCEGFS